MAGETGEQLEIGKGIDGGAASATETDKTDGGLLSKASADAPKTGGSDTGDKGTEDANKGKETVDTTKTDATKGGEAKTVIPEKYEFKLPEGVTLQPEQMAEVETVFKKLGLSQEQAQSLMDFDIDLAKRNQEKSVKDLQKRNADWEAEARKELGADIEVRLAKAAKGLENFAPPEIRKIMAESGWDNNIHFIKFFENLGDKISEDTLLEGKSALKTDLSALSPQERLTVHIQQEQDRLDKNKK